MPGRLLKGRLVPASCGKQFRLCFHPNEDWCIEFDQNDIDQNPTDDPEQPGRKVLRLKRNVPILEIRKDSIEKILHGTISTLAKPAKPNKDDDDDGGVVGDPTSRSSLC